MARRTTNPSLRPVGFVRSSLTVMEDAPKQGSEGAPAAWLEIDPAFHEALDGLAAGDEVIVLTWLHRGRRDVLKVHPRGDPENPLTGVFATRSPDRPNPIGLHRVRVLEIAGAARLRVEPLEALDGTPVVDVKPVLSEAPTRSAIHHIDLTVGDLARSTAFYDRVLPLLGFRRSASVPEGPIWAGAQLEIGLVAARSRGAHDRYSPGLHHLAFTAPARAAVDAFHERLVALGVMILDAPAEYPQYAPGYYAVFFGDPDGLKLEYVFTPRWPA